MDAAYLKVREFHEKFGSPHKDIPELVPVDRVEKRYNWMLEEINEFKEAKSLDEQADAMIDLIYFALGTMVEMGVKPEELFDIVHRANMSKLWEDGKPRMKDTKVMKPPTWVDPKPLLIEAIQRQSREKRDLTHAG